MLYYLDRKIAQFRRDFSYGDNTIFELLGIDNPINEIMIDFFPISCSFSKNSYKHVFSYIKDITQKDMSSFLYDISENPETTVFRANPFFVDNHKHLEELIKMSLLLFKLNFIHFLNGDVFDFNKKFFKKSRIKAFGLLVALIYNIDIFNEKYKIILNEEGNILEDISKQIEILINNMDIYAKNMAICDEIQLFKSSYKDKDDILNYFNNIEIIGKN